MDYTPFHQTPVEAFAGLVEKEEWSGSLQEWNVVSRLFWRESLVIRETWNLWGSEKLLTKTNCGSKPPGRNSGLMAKYILPKSPVGVPLLRIIVSVRTGPGYASVTNNSQILMT